MPPKGYLQRLREICDQYGILLVFDEVICGFGRTGRAFGADSFEVTPDLMTMAKALTNGAQPMGAVAVHEKIWEAISVGAPEETIELFHGYTFSAHPAATAAALATLEIYEREDLFRRAAELSPYFLDRMFELAGLPGVTDVRGFGLLAAFDLAPEGTPGTRGFRSLRRLYDEGLLIKWTGDTGIIAPPLIAERDHIDELASILRRVLSQG